MLANKSARRAAGFDVAANQGQFLALLGAHGAAQRVLEIGTLGGYSTIWMARELPEDGELLTLEADPRHAPRWRAKNLRLAEVDKQVTRRRPALQT